MTLPKLSEWKPWGDPLIFGKKRFFREFVEDPKDVGVMVEGREGSWKAYAFSAYIEEEGDPRSLPSSPFGDLEEAKAAADAAWFAQPILNPTPPKTVEIEEIFRAGDALFISLDSGDVVKFDLLSGERIEMTDEIRERFRHSHYRLREY